MIGIDAVDVELGGATVLARVSTTVERGTFVGLVGPNGAGKTTLLRTINGRLRPDRGSVTVDGDVVAGMTAREIGRRVATVPQETSLSFEFDVRTIVEMGRTPHRGRFSVSDPGAHLVDRAMERTRVSHLGDRSVRAISGGERQRVLLARALAQDADVLLLDEPTASLDVNHQVATLDLVRGLADEGRTVVAAIHDLDLAARYCDELLLLADGRIRATGPPTAVLDGDLLGEAFDARVAVGRDPVTGTPTVTALPEYADRDGRIHVLPGGGSGAGVLYPLVAAGYEVTVGPVPAGDVDARTARHLGLDTVVGTPFGPPEPATVEAAVDAARAADVVLLADLDVARENPATPDVADAADRFLVVTEGRPAERADAEFPDTGRYPTFLDRAHVVPREELLDAVSTAIEARTDRTISPGE